MSAGAAFRWVTVSRELIVLLAVSALWMRTVEIRRKYLEPKAILLA
jgi:hypothetical protein